jgi:hypothetical protein
MARWVDTDWVGNASVSSSSDGNEEESQDVEKVSNMVV